MSYRKTSHAVYDLKYHLVWQYLRRMQKLGQKGRVDQLVQSFRDKYKNRRALLDELKSV